MRRVGATRVGYVDHLTWLLKADGYRNILACVNIEERVENEIRFLADSCLLARIPRSVPIAWSPFDASPPVLEKSELRDHLEQSHQEAKDAISTYLLNGSSGFHLPVNLEGLIEQVVLDSGESFNDIFEVKEILTSRL